MAQALILAEKHDVYLGVEPELANVIDSPAQARRLIDEMCSPRIKIVLDPTNLFEQAGTEARCARIAGAVDLLADRIMLAHAKDRAANGAFTTPGQGVIDFVHFFWLFAPRGMLARL